MNFTVKKESSACGCGDTIEAVGKCPNCNKELDLRLKLKEHVYCPYCGKEIE